jgi:hypothetical protein
MLKGKNFSCDKYDSTTRPGLELPWLFCRRKFYLFYETIRPPEASNEKLFNLEKNKLEVVWLVVRSRLSPSYYLLLFSKGITDCRI